MFLEFFTPNLKLIDPINPLHPNKISSYHNYKPTEFKQQLSSIRELTKIMKGEPPEVQAAALIENLQELMKGEPPEVTSQRSTHENISKEESNYTFYFEESNSTFYLKGERRNHKLFNFVLRYIHILLCVLWFVLITQPKPVNQNPNLPQI